MVDHGNGHGQGRRVGNGGRGHSRSQRRDASHGPALVILMAPRHGLMVMPQSCFSHANATQKPHHGHAMVMSLCHGDAMAMSLQVTATPRQRHAAIVTPRPRHSYAMFAMRSRNGLAMATPWPRLCRAMATTWPRHGHAEVMYPRHPAPLRIAPHHPAPPRPASLHTLVDYALSAARMTRGKCRLMEAHSLP